MELSEERPRKLRLHEAYSHEKASREMTVLAYCRLEAIDCNATIPKSFARLR